MAKRDPIYGIMAEFDSAQHLVDAARATHQAGYKKIDAYSPFPIEGLAEEIGFHFNEVPLVVLIGGIFAVALPGSLDYIRFLWREHTPVLNLPLDLVYSCFGIFLIAVIVRAVVSAVKLLGPRWQDQI